MRKTELYEEILHNNDELTSKNTDIERVILDVFNEDSDDDDNVDHTNSEEVTKTQEFDKGPNIFGDIEELRKEDKFTDTCLVGDDGKVWIHWPVLFGNHVQPEQVWWRQCRDQVDSDINVVIFTGVSHAELESMVKMLYRQNPCKATNILNLDAIPQMDISAEESVEYFTSYSPNLSFSHDLEKIPKQDEIVEHFISNQDTNCDSLPSHSWKTALKPQHQGETDTMPGDKKHKCSRCGKYYQHQGTLTRHQRYECGVKPSYSYNCSRCGKHYKLKGSLIRHQSYECCVDPSYSYKCSSCGKHYKHQAFLTRHQRYECGVDHSYSYNCSRCGKQYKLKGSLIRHQRYECGVKRSYSCPFCGIMMKRSDHLKNHIKKCPRKLENKNSMDNCPERVNGKMPKQVKSIMLTKRISHEKMPKQVESIMLTQRILH